MRKHTANRPDLVRPLVSQALADLVSPQAVLPEQFFSGPRCDSQASPERALMLAVLEDGVRCFEQFMSASSVRHRMLSRQAERWIRANDWDWPFSFNNVCDSLGIDPSCLRRALLKLKYQCLSGTRTRKQGKSPAPTPPSEGSKCQPPRSARRGKMKRRKPHLGTSTQRGEDHHSRKEVARKVVN